MKRKVFFWAICFLLLPAMTMRAELVSLDDARATAHQFVSVQQANGLRGISMQGRVALSDPVTIAGEGMAALYVFNLSGGGYVIVSAESDSRRAILAWSDEGSYDPLQVPEPMQAVLDSYVAGISHLRKASSAERVLLERAEENAMKSPAHRRVENLPDSVGPLLGDIKWNQSNPYNRMCPTYESNGNQYHFVTGCVATAIAQVMMYHRWPEQGRGSRSYEWNDQTLSADFSQSTYRWDLMLPTYTTDWNTGANNYTDEQADAVALLMHDVGVAMGMYYDYGGSSASFYGTRMVEYFDYDKNLRSLYAQYCSTDDWEGELRSELAAGRPVLCSGGSQGGGHEFVCDGYNAEGLFHYNFGWGGINDGWYASTATGFDSAPSIDYGVEKNQGGTGALSLYSSTDFLWTSGNTFSCSIIASCKGLDSSDRSLTLEIGFALRNLANDEVKYYTFYQLQGKECGFSSMHFDEDVPDGSYQLWPVARIAGQEWQTFFHHPLRQIVVDLTVSGGVKTWANNNLSDPIDEGVVKVDGIYYLLDEECGEATVTRRNEWGNSYSGDVVIPDEITYANRTYVVTAVGQSAFSNSSGVVTLTIGKNVRSLEFGCIDFCGLTSVVFAEGSQLTYIGGWAFNGCWHLTECILPEGVKEIGQCVFQGCSGLLKASIPSSVTTIASHAFNGFSNLQELSVHWTSLDGLYCAPTAFDGVDVSGIVLYVPEGYADLYRNAEPWSGFNIQESGDAPDPGPDPDPSEESQLYILGCDGNWNPASPSAVLNYREGDNVYVGDITVIDAEGGYGYFCIGTTLGDYASDWSTFNANRLGAPWGNFLLESGESCSYILGNDASFKALAGSHHLVVDMTVGTVAFDCPDGINAVPEENAEDAVYDLFGRRAVHLHQGSLYIRNGRKFIAR